MDKSGIISTQKTLDQNQNMLSFTALMTEFTSNHHSEPSQFVWLQF